MPLAMPKFWQLKKNIFGSWGCFGFVIHVSPKVFEIPFCQNFLLLPLIFFWTSTFAYIDCFEYYFNWPFLYLNVFTSQNYTLCLSLSIYIFLTLTELKYNFFLENWKNVTISFSGVKPSVAGPPLSSIGLLKTTTTTLSWVLMDFRLETKTKKDWPSPTQNWKYFSSLISLWY